MGTRRKVTPPKPFFDEANEPSDTWKTERAKLLGGDSETIAARIRAAQGLHEGRKRDALDRALSRIEASVPEVDERIAAKRWKEALTELLEVARKAASAASVRRQELEHFRDAECRAIGAPVGSGASRETSSSRMARIEGVTTGFAPRVDFARLVEDLKIKAYVSARKDTYRPSYGHSSKDYPRQCVFVGTTNEAEYLEDQTGNRRFWPVKCGTVDVEGITRDRDQLWAEAYDRYQRGGEWHADTPELREMCTEEQEKRTHGDAWESPVHRWLERQLTTNPVLAARGFTTADVAQAVLGYELSEINRAISTRVGTVLRKLGWVARELREGGRKERRYLPPAAVSTVSTCLSLEGEVGCDALLAENKAKPYLSQPSQPFISSIELVDIEEVEKPFSG